MRDLQGQATAKSGASKQSSSFLKATTMTLFTISDSEKASYIDQIYTSRYKRFIQSCERWSAIMLINIVVPGIIDERSVNTKRVLNPWKRSENHTLCLNSAKAIGCTVINIGTQDLVEGRPQTWKSLDLNGTKLFLLTFQRLNWSWER
ncbi:hypothetical protein OIU76_026583 [Salix suchowensis]|uniref:Calponin-homology (CH) domain-containing protein n=1 Tax=Salix suchowensis TaxID=1278906 RepID=A0ABQ9AU35_9ROSI|nr:hypothetical protein OIU77_006145 [Salix suchowensis]KAJ6372117.1 hypothetical protein OIU76_026583 [Salix suchowensis]